MSNYRVALRYDKSLLTLAIEQGALEEVHRDMALIDKICRENHDFTLTLRSPVISHQKKLAILRALFQGRVHNLTMRILEVLSMRNREEIIPELAAVFHEQYNEYKSIAEATVITGYPVTEDQRKKFRAFVQEKTKAKSVDLREIIDPDLIGGYVLRIGDKQIDDSLKSKLKELKIKFES